MYRNFSKVQNYIHDNVEVYFIRYPALPKDISSGFRGRVFYKAVSKFLKKHKTEFDIIYAHFTYPSDYIAVKLKEDYGKKALLLKFLKN